MYPGAVVSEYHLQMPRQYEGLAKLSRKEMNAKSSFVHFLRQPEHPILGSESARRSEFHATKGGPHLSKYELDLLLYAHNRDEHARQVEEKRRLRELVESQRALKAEQKLQSLNVPRYKDGVNGEHHSLAETSMRNWAKAYAPADLERYDACVQLARKAEIEEKMIKKAQVLYETEQRHIASLLSSNQNFETRKRDQTVEEGVQRSHKASTKAKKIDLAGARRDEQLQQSHDATVAELQRQEASVERVLELRDEQRRQRGREKLAELDRREQQVRAAAEAFENRRYVKRRASLTLTQKETSRARRVNKKLINEIAVETHNDIEFRSQRAYRCWEKSWELRDKKRHDTMKRRDELDTRFSSVRAEQSQEWKEKTGFKRKRWKSKQQYVGQLQASQAQQRSERLKEVLRQVEGAQKRKAEALSAKMETTNRRTNSSEREVEGSEVVFVGEEKDTQHHAQAARSYQPSPPSGGPQQTTAPSPKAQQAQNRQTKHVHSSDTLPILKSSVTSGTFSLAELQADPSGSKASPSPPQSPPPVSGRSVPPNQSQTSDSRASGHAQGQLSPRRGAPTTLTLPTGPKTEVDDTWISERLKVMEEKQRAADKRHAEVLKRVQLTAGKELARVDKKREDHELLEEARQKEIREMIKAKAESPRVRPIEFRESLTARGPRRYESDAELFQGIPFCNSARLGTLRSPRPASEAGLQQRLSSTRETAQAREERANQAKQRREDQIATITHERNLHLQQHIRKHEDLSTRLERRAHMAKIRHQQESCDHAALLTMQESIREEQIEKSKKDRQKREEEAELRHQQHLSEVEEKARRTVRQPVPPSRSPRSNEDDFYVKEEQRRNRYVIDVNS